MEVGLKCCGDSGVFVEDVEGLGEGGAGADVLR